MTWDLVLVALFFVIGAALGRNALQTQAQQSRAPAFYQNWLGAAAYDACGFGFVEVPIKARTPVLDDFLKLKSDSITCADLPTSPLVQADAFARMHRYLGGSLTLLWKLRGIRWSAIGPLFELFSGSVSALVYLLFRLGMNRWWSIAGAAAIATSGLNLFYLHKLRDYSKAPFLLASLLITGWLVTKPLSTRQLLWLAALFGAVFGIGIGFRTDVVIAIPLFVLVIAFLLPTPQPPWRTRAAALLMFAATVVVTGWPLLFTYSRGSNSGHATLMGYTEMFGDMLGLEQPEYRLNVIYGDRPIEWAARNYEMVNDGGPGWSAGTSSQYDRQSRRLVRAVVQLLPADTVIHVYAAILRVLESPFSVPGQEDCETLRPSIAGTACHARNVTLQLVPRVAAPLAAAMLLILALAIDPRRGLFLSAIIVSIIGSTALQFDPRHTFYLEFTGLWSLAFLLQRVPLIARRPMPMPNAIVITRAIVAGLLLVTIPAIVLIAARALQQRALTDLFTRYLAADTTPVPVAWPNASVSSLPLDHLLPAIDPFAPNALSQPTVHSGIFRIDVGGPACAGHSSYVSVRYEVPFNGQLVPQAATMHWTVPADGSPVHVFMPFYRMLVALPGGTDPIGEVRLIALDVPPTEKDCLRALATFRHPTDFPIVPMAALGPDWQAHRLYLTFSPGGAKNSPHPGYP